MSDYKLTAVLPMRGGSKRVPRKNLRQLGGKPLFAWALEEVASLKIVDRLVVDSEDGEILEKVNELFPEIETSRRPKSLAGDRSSMIDVLKHFVDNHQSDWYLQFHSTSPFIRGSEISEAWKQMMQAGRDYDSSFSVSRIQARMWSKEAKPINHDPENLLPTQELETIFVENSLFYFFSRDALFSSNNRIGSNPLMFPTSELSSVDIDTEDQFILADSIARGINN